EMPGKNKTLTLAEVEVYSNGRNVARGGTAKQISTAFGGDASRAIDGNTSGKYADGGQTHTAENIGNPWWEVDLGAEYAITSITIYNRTADNFGKRLNTFTLRLLAKGRNPALGRRKHPAPDGRVASR